MNLQFLALLQEGNPPAPGPQGMLGTLASIVPFILIFGVFWLLILRPEQKARKKRAELLSKLAKGDKVMTTGGLFGSVANIQDDVVTLQVADGVRMRFARSAIQTIESPTDDKAVEVKTNNA